MVVAASTLTGCRPVLSLSNPCRSGRLPNELADHPLVRAAWHGLDASKLWDCHVHLFGSGDSDAGVWINPSMYRWTSPLKVLQRRFYENAACTGHDRSTVDAKVVERLVELIDGMQVAAAAAGAGKPKAMLLAFDWLHDSDGRPDRERSTFHVPNEYTQRIAAGHPEQFEWVASIHPYRADAVPALETAVSNGARAVKWLPSAMAIDPSDPRCDPFYRAAARLQVPILSHAGEELAIDGDERQHYGNPLRLRRALDSGVRVIVAHCASLGTDVDLDSGTVGPRVSSFALFARLMSEPRYRDLLLADVSALPQRNRAAILGAVLEKADWHPRLLYGSDYPLPGVIPLFPVSKLADSGWLSADAVPVLERIREHNALIFDFVLKRSVRAGGRAFSNDVFTTRRFFAGAAAT